jgi:hypothetical protein
MRIGTEPASCAGLKHCNIVDDNNEAATTLSSNMQERAEDACAMLSSKLNPVTFKQDLPSTGPLRGIKPRMKGDSE